MQLESQIFKANPDYYAAQSGDQSVRHHNSEYSILQWEMLHHHVLEDVRRLTVKLQGNKWSLF